MENFYRPILKSATNLTWKNKILWFFGLFAALLGNGGEYNLVVNNLIRISNQGSWLETLKYLYQNNRLYLSLGSVKDLFTDFNFISALIFVLLIAFFIFIIWLVIVAQAGLYGRVFQLSQKVEESNNFFQTLRIGKKNFWSVLWLNIISKILIYLFLFIIALPLVYFYLITQGSGFWWFIITLLSFIILIPGTFIIALVVRYAVIKLVTSEGQTWQTAFKYGFRLFKSFWLISLETAFLLFIINILLTLLMIVGLMIVLLPFVLIGAVAIYTQLFSLFWFMVGMGVIVFFIIVIIYGSLLSTFQHTVWTKVYIYISQGQGVSRLARWFTSTKTV